jgi:hypothetical protein
MPILPLWLLRFALAALTAFPASATSPPVPGPWELAQRLDFNAAHAAFAAIPDPSDRTIRLGLAATLLNRQPKTNANRDHAAAQLEALLTEATDDAPALAARYLLGRIALAHTAPPDPALARRHFAALAKPGADHAFAALAAGQVLLLDLADPATPTAERLARGDGRIDIGGRVLSEGALGNGFFVAPTVARASVAMARRSLASRGCACANRAESSGSAPPTHGLGRPRTAPCASKRPT